MQNELTPVQMLDKVLEWFNWPVDKTPGKVLKRDAIVREWFMPNIVEDMPELNTTEFLEKNQMLMRKLAKDELVLETISHYVLTFEGMIFHAKGGYAGDIAARNQVAIQQESAKAYQLELAEAQRSQAETLNVLTIWIAIGSVIAGIYYAVEIAKAICR